MASSFTIEQNGELKLTTISYTSSGIPYMTGDISIQTSNGRTYGTNIVDNNPGNFIYEHKSTPIYLNINVICGNSIGTAALQFNISGIGGTSVYNEVNTDLSVAKLHTQSSNTLLFSCTFVPDHDGGYSCILKDCTIGGTVYNEIRFGFTVSVYSDN